VYDQGSGILGASRVEESVPARLLVSALRQRKSLRCFAGPAGRAGPGVTVDSKYASAPDTPQQPQPPMMRTLSSELMDLSSAEDSLVAPEVADCPSPRGSSLHGSTLSPAKDALARLRGASPSQLSRSLVRTVSSNPREHYNFSAIFHFQLQVFSCILLMYFSRPVGIRRRSVIRPTVSLFSTPLQRIPSLRKTTRRHRSLWLIEYPAQSFRCALYSRLYNCPSH
jgi:hypothetical protein